jgi:fumarate reductase subunit D
MKKALAFTSASLAVFALPLVSLAAINNLSDAGSFIINTINNVLVPVLFAVAFIVFLWGAFYTFIVGANNEEVKEKGKNLMIYGLIGFFVMVSIWGLVNILTGTVSFGNNTGVTGGTPKAGVNVGP